VSVESSAADHISARWRKGHLAAPRQQGRGEKNRRPDLRAEGGIQVGRTQILGVDIECVLADPLHRRSDRANQLDERLDVANAGDV